jgi:hypothetical protein
MALDLVERLAKNCTCGALEPLNEIISRLVHELSTLARIGGTESHASTTTTTTTTTGGANA